MQMCSITLYCVSRRSTYLRQETYFHNYDCPHKVQYVTGEKIITVYLQILNNLNRIIVKQLFIMVHSFVVKDNNIFYMYKTIVP